MTGEEGEKVRLKNCLAGELNPGLQRERQEHWPLYQGGLMNCYRKFHQICVFFSIPSAERLLAIRHYQDGVYGLTLYFSSLKPTESRKNFKWSQFLDSTLMSLISVRFRNLQEKLENYFNECHFHHQRIPNDIMHDLAAVFGVKFLNYQHTQPLGAPERWKKLK